MINHKRLHTCQQCGTMFQNAIYWFDSLYAENYKKRIIKPFCGPKCVQEWHEANDAINFPLRKPPYPKGEEWIVTQNIDFMDYKTD
jgi:NAD-dependent SIR2 family protein deacetylase